MSIRRTIEGLLQDPADHAAFSEDPEAFFAERGITDLPSDLIGSSFGHFSDIAPIEQSDAVAGIATRFGPVPFEESDLPDFDPSADDVDPFATLGSLDDSFPLGDATEDRFDDTTADDASADHEGTGDPTADDTDVDPTDDADGDPTSDEATSDADGTIDDGRDAAPHDQTDDASEATGDDGFGSGGFATTSMLDNDLDDDPFYDEVTSEDTLTLDHFSSADVVTTYVPDDDPAGFEPAIVEDSYESFPEEDTSAFDDIDPGDLELDDI